MCKYFYFCVTRFEDVYDTRIGRTKRVPVCHFGKNVYGSAILAVLANAAWMCKHLGERFSITGLEHQLELDENGVSQGFKAADDDSAVINMDLKGAIALMKRNAKSLKVEL